MHNAKNKKVLKNSIKTTCEDNRMDIARIIVSRAKVRALSPKEINLFAYKKFAWYWGHLSVMRLCKISCMTNDSWNLHVLLSPSENDKKRAANLAKISYRTN